jgi:hypothetical protein
VVGGVLAMKGAPVDVVRAETLVVALDGVLLGAILRKPDDRADYLRRCVALLLEGLSPAVGPELG